MRVSVVTVAVHSTSEHDGRRAAEKMYGGALSWVLTKSGEWVGTHERDGAVASVHMQAFEVSDQQSSAGSAPLEK